jgi:hypothetical protein
MRGRVCWSCAALSCALGVPALVTAAPLTRLTWDAPESCPGIGAVTERLAALRGDALEHGGPEHGGLGTVRGVIRREGQGFQLTLELLDGGERKSRLITASACGDLVEAAAVAIALALDTRAAESVAEQAEEPVSNAAAPRPEDSVTEPAARAAPAARVFVHAVLDAAALAQPAFGIGAELRAELGRFGLGAYGAWLPPRSEYVSSQRFVDFSLWFAGIRGCGRLFDAVVEGSACAGFDAGVLRAEGSGLSRSRQVNDPWLAPNASFELGLGLWQGLGLQARAEAAVPLVRRPYVVNETEGVHRPPVFVPRLWLGLFWAIE